MAEMDHEKLQSSLTSATKSLARRMSYKMPEFSINITADEPLQLTLTKKCLKLIVDVAAVSLLCTRSMYVLVHKRMQLLAVQVYYDTKYFICH